MFFCKYKIYHIKKRSTIYKKHKFKLIGIFLFVVLSVFIIYIENNIQSIISNKFSENKSYNLSIDDVDFSLSGKFALKNFLILNKNNDSIIYSEILSVDPISLSKAIYEEDYNFRNINFIDGFVNVKYLLGSSNLNTDLKINDSLIFPSQNTFINNIELKNFKIRDDNKVIIDLFNIDIEDLEVSNNNFNLNINDINFKYGDFSISKLNSNVSYKNDTLSFNDFNLNLNNSNFNGGFNILDPFGTNDFKISGFFEESIVNTSDFISNSNPKLFDVQSNFLVENNKVIINNIQISDNENYLQSSVVLSDFVDNTPKLIQISFDEFNSSSLELESIFPNIFGSILPSSLKSIGLFKLKGDLYYTDAMIQSSFDLSTKDGNVFSNLQLSDFTLIDNAKYNGDFKGSDINLSKIIGLPFLGKSNFDFSINGRGFTQEFLNTSIEGNIFDVDINDYKYEDIIISGNVNNKIFDGYLSVNDENLEMDFSGLVNFTDDIIDFDFTTNIEKSNLFQLKLSKLTNTSLSGLIVTKLRGNDFENLIGDVSFSNFKYQTDEIEYNFEELIAQSRINNDRRFFNIISEDVVDGIIIGGLDSFDLLKTISNGYLSKYSNYSSVDLNDEVVFNLNVKSKIAKVISSDFNIDDNTFLSGRISNDIFELSLSSPLISSSNFELKDVNFSFKENEGNLKVNKLNSEIFSGNNLNMSSEFKDDKTFFEINYNSEVLNVFKFDHTISDDLKSVFNINDIVLNYNNSVWYLDKLDLENNNVFVYGEDYKELKSVKLVSGNQIIEFNFLDNNIDFDFNSTFQNVNFESLIPKPKNILYQGLVNGYINLNKKDKIYQGNSNLSIKNFSANGDVLGNAFLKIYPSNKLDNYNLLFNINDSSYDIFKLEGNFEIASNDFPIDLELKTEKFKLNPFSAIGENVLQNFQGYFNSNILIGGTFYDPVVKGFIKTDNTSFTVPYLGIRYGFKDNPSFKVDNEKIIIDNFIIEDKKMKTFGFMNGQLSHNRLKDWFLDFTIKSDNLYAINTNAQQNPVYYGTGMFNGLAKFYGPGKDLDIDIIGETNSGTQISVPIKYGDGVGDLTFLKFDNSDIQNQFLNQGLEISMEMILNKNALINIIFDEKTGSRLSGYGNGTIKISSDYSGLFSLSGDFIADKGEYYYKNFGFVERVFQINKGANIIWDGEPYKGVLSAYAEYSVPGGANPAPLIQNTAFNRKIPTLVKISLQGELSNLSTPTFDLIFPETKGAIKSELDYYLNDYEKRQSQAISLITQGTFIDDFSSSLISSQAITNNLFQRASGIIDEIFTNPDDKMNIGINYSQGDKFAASSLLNRDRIGLTLNSEISDRILINGKIGVPVSGTDENVILGNVQIDFLLNESGNLRARIFNKENEFQFFGDEIGYTQGIGIQYDVEFNSFSELLKKIKKNNKKN